MALVAPPVSRDGFIYYGSFYVEVDDHRHPRCNSNTLYTLLTWTDPPPLLTKKGTVAKRQPEPHKDSPGHFYQAQCIHYGLKGYKQKPAAKKHLLAAFHDMKTLAVPAHILVLEKSLEEEYKVANEIAKQKAKGLQDHQEKMYLIERKRMQEERAKERQKEREGADAMLKEFAAAGIVINQGELIGTESDNEDRLMVKQGSEAQLRKDIAALSETQLRAMVEKLVFDKKVVTLKKALVKELDALKKVQAARAKASNGKGKGKAMKQLFDTMDDEGEYLILAPYLRDGWGSETQTMKLKMSSSPGRSHHWVWFHFGVISGIMRSHGAPPMQVGDKTHFLWRGREEGEGEMTYGSNNTASITFAGDGRIRGRMRWNGSLFEFVGKKVPRENIVWSRSVQNWKGSYRGINDRSYEYARKARWGGGGGWYGEDAGGDVSSNSDTVGDPYAQDSDDESEFGGAEGFDFGCAL